MQDAAITFADLPPWDLLVDIPPEQGFQTVEQVLASDVTLLPVHNQDRRDTYVGKGKGPA